MNQPVGVPVLFCPTCRQEMTSTSSFCPRCGKTLSDSTLRYVRPATSSQEAPASWSLFPLWAALVGLVAVIVFAALGLWWEEVALVPATVFLAVAGLDEIADRLDGRIERTGQRLIQNLWAFARLCPVAVRGWWRTSAARVRVRTRQLPVRRRHERAIRQLGQAVYCGDDRGTVRAKALASQTAEQIERFELELAAVRAEAEQLVHDERMATDATSRWVRDG